MSRKRTFIDGFLIRTLVFIGCWALSSCGDFNNTFSESEQPIPVQLCISLTDNDYTSDEELIPMDTRADKSYVITRIVNHTLFILKKINGSDWIVEDVRTNIIKSPNKQVLNNGESLSLTEDGKNFLLLPGEYCFVLYLNNKPKINKGDLISMYGEKSVTTGSFPQTDFYFAQDRVIVQKSTGLSKQIENKVVLGLKRNSSLIRFILEKGDEDWTEFTDPTITCQLWGETCIGINILGDPVIGSWEGSKSQEFQVNMAMDNEYIVNGKFLCFSSKSKTLNNLSLFAIDNIQRTIKLIITNIGNPGEYSFEGAHTLENVPIRQNYITTILIRKTGKNTIQTEVNPEYISSEWSSEYPPLNYIELNN